MFGSCGPPPGVPSMMKGRSCWKVTCQRRTPRCGRGVVLQAVGTGLGGLAQDGHRRRPRPRGERASGLPVQPVGAGRQDRAHGHSVGHDRALGVGEGGVEDAVTVRPLGGRQHIGGGVAPDHAAACARVPVPDPQVDVVDRGGRRRPGLVGEERDLVDEPAARWDGEVVGHAKAGADRVTEAVGGQPDRGLQRAGIGAAGTAAGVGDERPVVVQHNVGPVPHRDVEVGRRPRRRGRRGVFERLAGGHARHGEGAHEGHHQNREDLQTAHETPSSVKMAIHSALLNHESKPCLKIPPCRNNTSHNLRQPIL